MLRGATASHSGDAFSSDNAAPHISSFAGVGMRDDAGDELTRLLERWHAGDRAAFDALVPRVYTQLLSLARARLRGEHPDHTLDTAALVHETYLRLAGGTTPDFHDRDHFFAVASTAMRRVLIDHAKQRLAQKRGGALVHVTLDPAHWDGVGTAATAEPDALVALDESLTRLAADHPRHAKAVELRYFAGLTLEEAARILGTSAPTVLRDLRFAQAWLARDLAHAVDDPTS
jgi:RNA polymerase sigma-70 factor (ECF subfamily)